MTFYLMLLAGALVGLTGGLLSGILGIGGGVVLVPLLIAVFKLSPQMAQGTSLALLTFPIAILGTYTYATNGLVDWKILPMLAIGFILGSPLGARLAVHLPVDIMGKIFGAVLIVIGIKMIFFK